MGLIRAYQKTTSSQTNAWRVYKRLVVTIQSLDYLSTIYREGNYQPPVGFAETEEGKHINDIEVIQLYTIYEKLVYTLTQFPRSGESSSLVLNFVNRFAKDFALIGGSETEKRGYLEALNRAHLKTFNSPCITRHVFHGLISLGDYQEAEHALHTYLYLVGLESKALFDAKSDTPALASDSFGYSTPVPHADGQNEVEHLEQALKSDGPEKSSEEESAIDQVGVITAGVKMYCQELSKGAEAVRIAELSEMIYKRACNEKVAEGLNVLGAEVYHTLGIALGFLASQTFDPETRPKFYARALDALKKALEFDNRNWEIYYQMALQLAEMHDIMQAIQMVTQSIQLNQQHLPSWHLLALLCTCPVKNNKPQALRTCDIGLSQASSILEDTWVDYSDEVEQQVKLYMLHALLTEQVHGTEAALGLQESLFQMFGKIVVPELIPNSNDMLHEAISNGNTRYGMVLSGSLGNMSNEPTVSSGQKVSRGRSASNASRSSSVIVKGGRARSVSSFTGRKLHLAELFSEKTDTNSTHSVPHTSSGKHGSRLNMLDPKHLMRKQKREMSDDSAIGTVTLSLFTNALVTANGGGSASSIYSVSQSVLSTNTLLQNTNPLNRPTIQARLQHQRSCHMLCDMWLLSAEIFLRSGKIEESLKAVSEAENVDWTTHAGVWCMLGRIRLAQKLPEEAIKAFQKGLVAKPNDVNCRVWLAKTYVERGDLEVAEGLLEAVTKENGWDCAAAWFYLGEIYKKTDRIDKTKDCLFYALELESTTPIQPFNSLPRCVQ
ncbi:hypothetical protein EDC96DRAFT_449880 [Choanephora cucurbitarum]|nr:hypothetical protein EDC96DRAFT_449880 [Choanephora cucurbitarum]